MKAQLSSPWIMTVPVISTAHMPSATALSDLKITPVMFADFGGLVYVEDGAVHEATWLDDLAEGLDAPDGWIRLDSAGLIVDGLPIYDW